MLCVVCLAVGFAGGIIYMLAVLRFADFLAEVDAIEFENLADREC